VAATKTPIVFRLLAIVGVLLGSFGSFYTLLQGTALLAEHDQYVRSYREAAERALPPLAPGTPDDRGALFEKVADARYARRGVALPLAAINVILSLLLLAGCLRALRGQAWGLSAWTVAAAASIPYQVLDAAHSALELRDVAAIVQAPGDHSIVFVLGWMCVMILYYGVCVIYLRRPEVKARFTV
jgi:hypothetical protein